MTDTTPPNAADATPPTDDETTADRPDLNAVVVAHDSGSDECTLYPRGASDEALVTEWMTAEEGRTSASTRCGESRRGTVPGKLCVRRLCLLRVATRWSSA